ncbi:MAG: SCO family protein [Ferruginibacter sp.]
MKYIILFGLLSISQVACVNRQPAVLSDVQTDSSLRLPYYTTADFTPHWLKNNEEVPVEAHTIPEFSFTDQAGRIISQQTTNDKIYLANFFFTSCRGICPKLSNNLKIVQDALLKDEQVLILSHSVMPEADDVIALQRYAKNYGVINKRWHLLTGNKDSIYTIARQSYFADEDMGMQKTKDDFLHTENILLIDKHRHIRGIYKGTSQLEMQAIIEDINILVREK